MKKWTIGKRITFGFAVLLVILVALSIIMFTRIRVIHDNFVSIAEENIPAMELLGDLSSRTREDEAIVYKHIYSPSEKDMDELEAKLAENSRLNSQAYEQLVKFMVNGEEKKVLDNIKAARSRAHDVKAQILAASRAATNSETSGKLAARARVEYDPLAAAYMKALDDGTETQKTENAGAVKENAATVRAANTWLLIGSVSGLALGILMAWMIVRGVGKVLRSVAAHLTDGSAQTVAASSQVSSSAQSLAQGAGEQAASLEETSSSMEELASTTKRNAENARKANDLARQTRAAADTGAADMQAMNQAMEAIKNSSDDISKIIKTIDEIAFQTNILALNAAVEAARAGEAGMGFAVVADEVRNLAQRCAQSAKETSSKIEGAITRTAQGVELSSKVARALQEILTKARQVDELVAEVANASNEQSNGITQVNLAVSQMDKVTQSNAASAEECAAAAEEMNSQAELLKDSVEELLRLVEGGQTQTVGARARQIPLSRSRMISSKANGIVEHKPAAPASNGNGHAPPKRQTTVAPVPLATNGHKPAAVPMPGDFKDF